MGCLIVGTAVLAACSGNKKAKEDSNSQEDTAKKEQEILSQSYMKICSVNGISYFANGKDEILELSGYYSLDEYIFHNVLNGQTSGDEKQWFIMDTKGNYKVQPGTYEYIKRINDTLFRVEKDDKYGIVDYNGKVIVPVEYEQVDYYIDSEADHNNYGYLVGEKNDKYTLYTSAGVKLSESANEIGAHDVTVYPPYTSDSIWTIYDEVEDKLYNLKTGEMILEVKEGGRYLPHIYLYDGTATIYDANFKVKEVVKDFNTSLLSDRYKDLVTLGQTYVLTEKYELADLKEMRAADEAAKDKTTHKLANGSVYTSKIDEEAKIVYLYDQSGKEKCSYSYKGYKECKSINAYGNYIAIFYGDYAIVDPATGKVVLDNMDFVSENEYNDLIYVSSGTGSSSKNYIIFHGGKMLEFRNTQDDYMNENGVWINDRTNKNCEQYNLDGELLTKIDNVAQIYQLGDGDYILAGVKGGSSVIFNRITGEVTFENVPVNGSKLSESKFIPLTTYDVVVRVLAVDDGIYNMHGKKLVDFTAE